MLCLHFVLSTQVELPLKYSSTTTTHAAPAAPANLNAMDQ